ncbi:MAG: hypothetical protein BGO49_25555 [Planctomycetales bacterium 71-10]|nr:MAG: hypothetical protein BGO49_25555 [Planctomycetales bacterium 71-10]
MRRRLATVAILAAALALLGPAPRAAARVFLLVAADTNDRQIGESVAHDARTFPLVFRLHMPEPMMTYAPAVVGANFGAGRILAALRRLPVTPGVDTVILYYSGHGAYDQARGHYGQTPTGPLFHSQVEATMAALRPKLAVYISDACSVFQKLPPMAAAPAIVPPTEPPPLLRSLFLDPSGFVSISASMPGQAAMGRSDGGVFTNALVATCGANMQRRMSWAAVIQKVNQSTQPDYPNQTAYAVRPLPHSPRFGAVAQEDTARARAFGGMEITQVLPGTPAARVRAADGQVFTLTVGDVITHINGREVRNQAGYIAAVQGSPDRMALRIIDGSANAAADFTADLGGGEAAEDAGPSPSRPRFGAVAQEDTARARAFGGLEITRVVDGTPAARVRAVDGQVFTLQVGDVITHINNQAIRNQADYIAAVQGSPDRMTIRIVDGSTNAAAEYTAGLGASAPPVDAAPALAPPDGDADDGRAAAAPRTRLGASAMQTELNRDRGGVTVTEVAPGGPATKIRRGTNGETVALVPSRDIILSVDETPVGDAAEFRDAVAKAGPVVRLRIYDTVTKETDDYVADLPD